MVAVVALALGLTALPMGFGELDSQISVANAAHHDSDCAENGPEHAMAQTSLCFASGTVGIVYTGFAFSDQIRVRQAKIGIVDDDLAAAPLFSIFRPPRHA